jgi:DNA polymerase III epsilon subunit-like protein
VAIVQIDALFEEGTQGEPRLLLHSLVDPMVPGPWAGTCAHGLTVRDVVDAPTWPELRERVWPLLADPEILLVAHNASFDRRFLRHEAQALPESWEWLDTMRIGKRIGAANTKLDALCRARRIGLDGHRATTDAIATARLLALLIREAYQLPVEQRPPERPTVGQWLDWQRGSRRKAAPRGAAPSADQESLFGQESEGADARAARARPGPPPIFVVRGGVGGTMYCASANGTWPFRWVHRPDHARRFSEESWALDVARQVSGRVERLGESVGAPA